MNEPCQCLRSHAAVSPTHRGHCCFLPATQTCHPEAVAAWRAEGGHPSDRDADLPEPQRTMLATWRSLR